MTQEKPQTTEPDENYLVIETIATNTESYRNYQSKKEDDNSKYGYFWDRYTSENRFLDTLNRNGEIDRKDYIIRKAESRKKFSDNTRPLMKKDGSICIVQQCEDGTVTKTEVNLNELPDKNADRILDAEKVKEDKISALDEWLSRNLITNEQYNHSKEDAQSYYARIVNKQSGDKARRSIVSKAPAVVPQKVPDNGNPYVEEPQQEKYSYKEDDEWQDDPSPSQEQYPGYNQPDDPDEYDHEGDYGSRHIQAITDDGDAIYEDSSEKRLRRVQDDDPNRTVAELLDDGTIVYDDGSYVRPEDWHPKEVPSLDDTKDMEDDPDVSVDDESNPDEEDGASDSDQNSDSGDDDGGSPAAKKTILDHWHDFEDTAGPLAWAAWPIKLYDDEFLGNRDKWSLPEHIFGKDDKKDAEDSKEPCEDVDGPPKQKTFHPLDDAAKKAEDIVEDIKKNAKNLIPEAYEHYAGSPKTIDEDSEPVEETVLPVDKNGNQITENADTTDQWSQPNNTFQNRSAASDYAKTYNTFSGHDMVTTFELPVPGGGSIVRQVGELMTISYSLFSTKSPVRVLGNMNAVGYVFGERMLAGSMVFMVFDRHWALDMMKEYAERVKTNNHFLIDEVPPINITISMANEYGQKARLSIFGVTFVSEGQIMTIEDIYTENTFEFYALDISYMEKSGDESDATLKKNPTDDVETAPTDNSPSTDTPTDNGLPKDTDKPDDGGHDDAMGDVDVKEFNDIRNQIKDGYPALPDSVSTRKRAIDYVNQEYLDFDRMIAVIEQDGKINNVEADYLRGLNKKDWQKARDEASELPESSPEPALILI